MTAETPIHTQGEQLGPYELERLLGRGAAAEVWQATESGDLGFRKRQALKLLRPPPGEMEAQKKALITEARVCGHLKHPGVVDVYRVGEHEGEIFVAMEFVDGPDLNTFLEGLRRQRIEIPVPVCIEMAIEIFDALDHAHTAKDDDGSALEIIHRDLKPSNILVDRRGVLKITDWGLVKSTINLESTTRGVVKGTPGYIAPEVWGGTRDFRPSVDLFAVGAMLYEFVLGERLFQGRNLARIAEQVARRKPEEEGARLVARAPQLAPVVARLLQRVPANRYQTAEEAAAVLREIHGDIRPRTTLKDFLRDISGVIQELSPAVTGTGRIGVDPAMAATPGPGPGETAVSPPVAATNLAAVDQGAATVADGPGPAPNDEEQPTDPNLTPLGKAAGGPPVFEAPRTLALPTEDQLTEGHQAVVSAFGPDGPIGTEGVAAEVPATRAMPSIAMPSAVGQPAADLPDVPDEARETIPPEAGIKTGAPGPSKKKKRRRRPTDGTAPTGRKRKRRTSPLAPPPKKPALSKGALIAVVLGITLLVVGIVLAVVR